ncbi:hypothetical protein HZY88_08465 [Aerococcaceae bacterium DSM 111176]|nr:hypothetical protein [Aerococcaceae bacterium DSM 111176]
MTDKLEKRIAKLEKENLDLTNYVNGLGADVFFLKQELEEFKGKVDGLSWEVEYIAQ